MSYALAVDVGTSFTAAAVVRFDHGASRVPECLPLGARGAAIPSVLYYPEQGAVLVGEAAERRGLDFPERVVREFKRRIGDEVPIILGTLALQPEDIFATMARWVADRAAEREGGPASEVFLTHPAAWGSHRLSSIRDALAAHGLHNVTLLPEPEAAALHYASQVRVEEGSTIAVYDLGGGTFDTAVLRKAGSSRFELLGRPEGIEDLGGADFDAALFRYVAAHTGNALDGLDPADPAVLGALARLRRECVEAKEALSVDSEATIPVLLPGVQQQVRLVRAEFEALIEEPVHETVAALERSLAQLQLAPADLSTVLLIGGSSRIPLVAQVVSEELDLPVAVDADPKSAICLGAAVAAVLAHHAAAEAAAPARSEAGADEALAAVVPAVVPPAPPAAGRPSWSRKYTLVAGAPAGPALRGPQRRRRGAHAPAPTVRVTAVAAAAALLTVLTATAAQSPDGFGSLTAMFVPQAGASTTGGSGAADTGGGGATAPDSPQPLAGVEASARKPLAQGPGLSASALPTSGQAAVNATPTAGANPPAAGPAAEGPAAGAGAPAVPGDPGTDGTGAGAPAPGATDGTAPTAESATGDPTTPPATQTPGDPTATDTQDPTDPGTTDPGTTDPGTTDPTTPGATEPPAGDTGTPTATDSPSPTDTTEPSLTPTDLAAEASPTPQAPPAETTPPVEETAMATAPTTPPAA
ncbi:Hsp70 family protein [Pseudarthrobacter phenanthrenivorans]|uniref:Hsp70 family protein n=1 Tax=Pseudarthrobacter phenanthrenivorans TaxID=361575 RepID=UPI003F552153